MKSSAFVLMRCDDVNQELIESIDIAWELPTLVDRIIKFAGDGSFCRTGNALPGASQEKSERDTAEKNSPHSDLQQPPDGRRCNWRLPIGQVQFVAVVLLLEILMYYQLDIYADCGLVLRPTSCLHDNGCNLASRIHEACNIGCQFLGHIPDLGSVASKHRNGVRIVSIVWFAFELERLARYYEAARFLIMRDSSDFRSNDFSHYPSR